jgi:hypothetical protein
MAAYGVNLVSGQAAVEIKPAVFLAVEMVDRHAVGIVVVPQNGEYAPLFPLEYLHTLCVCQLLPAALHASEHRFILL